MFEMKEKILLSAILKKDVKEFTDAPRVFLQVVENSWPEIFYPTGNSTNLTQNKQLRSLQTP